MPAPPADVAHAPVDIGPPGKIDIPGTTTHVTQIVGGPVESGATAAKPDVAGSGEEDVKRKKGRKYTLKMGRTGK